MITMDEGSLKVTLTNEMMLNIIKGSLDRLEKDNLEHIMIQARTRDGVAELNFSIMSLMPESEDSEDFYMETGNSINAELNT